MRPEPWEPASRTRVITWVRGSVWVLVWTWACQGAIARPQETELMARFESARQQSTVLAAKHPIYLVSSETHDVIRGEVFTTLDQPFSLVREVTTRSQDWCQILILHLNIKYCRASDPAPPTSTGMVLVGMGRKFDLPLDEVYWIRFNYRVLDDTPNHLLVELAAPDGPLGTKDYRLQIEALPLNSSNTLVALAYSQAYGLAARWAFQVYLATLGRGKVGFSIMGSDAQGKPLWVEGLRGVLERNAMRYHLAVETWLQQQALPPHLRMEASLRTWFDATEQFPRQLHEISWTQYLDMKRREVMRLGQWPMPEPAQHHWPGSP